MSRAKSRGVDIIALTDHDTLSGVEEARLAATELGLTLIPGIELSSLWGKIGVHIVGLGIDTRHPALVELVRNQQLARQQRNEQIARRLEQVGLENVLARAQALANGGQLGRPHFAELLVAEGYARDMAQAFKRYLGAGKRADVHFAWPPMGELITAIRSAGGVAVLAHPVKYGLTRTKLRALVSDFVDSGGEAIEVISGQQPSGVAADLARLAGEFGLVASCGSDFHQPDRPWQELGAFGTLPATISPVWQAHLHLE